MSYQIRACLLPSELHTAHKLIEKVSLRVEPQVTKTWGLYEDNRMIATGSIDHNVIKMIAVDPSHQGENITSLLLTYLIHEMEENQQDTYFIFSTKSQYKYFMSFNFSIVYEDEDFVMLENSDYPITSRLADLGKSLPEKKGLRAGLVMNCNPITNGHLFLIESAAKANDQVIIFLVEEDRSVFPFDVRYRLVCEATSHLSNVTVVPSTPYIISAATFPTYFLKEVSDASAYYMRMDVTIFATYFMPILSIDRRYVGEEPLDPMTNAYNDTMKTMLRDRLVIIPRKMASDQVISASLVRKMAKEKNFDALIPLVPEVTYQYLISKEGQALFS